MKKILVALAIAAFASTASATIASGPHDMTTVAGGTQLGSCQYCHAPHLWVSSNIAVGAGEAPLWNRNAPTTFTTYGTTVLGTVVGAPGARSQTCLSCHDSRQNVGTVNNGTSEVLTAAGMPLVGSVLTDDHPVGVTIPVSTEYQAPPDTSVAILANSQVECASCHEPHTKTFGEAFLRTSDPTTLCGACHLK